MATNVRTEMRVPTRAAPKPPSSTSSSMNSLSSNVWGSSSDFFGTSLQTQQKKKPPPRPPPPKFTIRSANAQSEKPKKPARPTELLTNLFGRRGSKQNAFTLTSNSSASLYSSTSRSTSSSSSSTSNSYQLPSQKTDMCLIDLSPPGSPTFTTRSSSDGVSVDSFGSDGNSNPSVFTGSSGSASQTESAFEDDFDFFGNLSSKKQSSQVERNDPWKISCTQDPFGGVDPFSRTNPIATSTARTASNNTGAFSYSQVGSATDGSMDPFSRTNPVTSTARSKSTCSRSGNLDYGYDINDPYCRTNPITKRSTSCSYSSKQTLSTSTWTATTANAIKEAGESNFFAFNDSGSPFDSQPKVPASKPFVMPTIIRAKKSAPLKPKDPPAYTTVKSSYETHNYSCAPRLTPTHSSTSSNNSNKLLTWDDYEADDDNQISESPPMPKIPPPPPPPEYIAGLEDGLVENSERPYGIALYDFPVSQPGDLELKEGDVVYLTKLINGNWMEGRVGNCEGMFPVSFVDVKIPLPGLLTNIVTALYTFKAETSEDLSFEEGARINVLSRISDDWLYGESEGKKGQFPANFVDKVPSGLPDYS